MRGQNLLSTVATKFEGSIEGLYVPWIGASSAADGPDAVADRLALDEVLGLDDVSTFDGVPLLDELPPPFEELHAVARIVITPTAANAARTRATPDRLDIAPPASRVWATAWQRGPEKGLNGTG
jgi:hypothetical protein